MLFFEQYSITGNLLRPRSGNGSAIENGGINLYSIVPTDYGGNERPTMSPFDIGAWEYQQEPMPPICFHPDSYLSLISGISRMIKEIQKGDQLEDGSTVIKVYRCSKQSDFYQVSDSIWVTKKHLLLIEGQKNNFKAAYKYRLPLVTKDCDYTVQLLVNVNEEHHFIPISDYYQVEIWGKRHPVALKQKY